MVEWLPTILNSISDAKVADVLREKIGLIELQRDKAIGERDVLATKFAQLKVQHEALESENAELQARLSDLPSIPFKVSDDYEFDTEAGYWIERKSRLRVCARCLFPPTKAVSPLFEAVGCGFETEYAMVWRCRQCQTDYLYKTEK